MHTRLHRGFEITKWSLTVIRSEPSLLILPLLSGVATVFLLAAFAVPVFIKPEITSSLSAWLSISQTGQEQGHSSTNSIKLAVAAVTGVLYLINCSISVFLNTALAACVVRRIEGGEARVGYGLRVASSRLPQIIGWALFTSSIGLILRVVESRSDIVDRIVEAAVGATWSVASCLVVPALAIEGLGPIAALQRSSKLITASWGEGASGSAGLAILYVPIFLVGILLGITGTCLMIAGSSNGVIILTLALCYFPLVLCLSSALNQIFIVGLYLYATNTQCSRNLPTDIFKTRFSQPGANRGLGFT
jgi:hypothetical protein